MPKQNGEEPAQRSKSPIKLCLLGALKEGTYKLWSLYNHVIKGNGTSHL